MSRVSPRPRRRDGHRHDQRLGVRRRRLVEPARAPRQQQRRRSEPSRLDAPLPDPVATRAIAGSRRVEADRARHRRQQRGRRGRVDHGPGREGVKGARRRTSRIDRRARSPARRRSAARGRGATGTTSTEAPARRSEPASAASAARRPAVPPSDTRRRSTGAIEPGILAPHGSRRPARNARHLPPGALRAHPVVGARAARGLREHHAHARRAVDRLPAGGRPARHAGGGGLARAGDPGADPRSRSRASCRRSRRRSPTPASRSSRSRPTTRTTCSCASATSSARSRRWARTSRTVAGSRPARRTSRDRLQPRRPRRRPRAGLRHRSGDAGRRLPGVNGGTGPPLLGDRHRRAGRSGRLRR